MDFNRGANATEEGGPLEALLNKSSSKKASMGQSLPRYFVYCAMAGAYVGMGVALMFSVSGPLYAAHSPYTTLVMGLVFGIALLLIVFAGAELFTGNNLTFALGAMDGRITWGDAGRNWVWCWLGNFAGALLFAWLLYLSGVFSAAGPDHQLFAVAAKKMHLPFGQLFVRGILCNWLVCLAVWCLSAVKSETAKIVLCAWCLLAFVSSGFEHSVANMTTLTLSLLLEHPDTVTVSGLVHNLVPVTLGNIVGGAGFVGGAYWYASRSPAKRGREASTPASREGYTLK